MKKNKIYNQNINHNNPEGLDISKSRNVTIYHASGKSVLMAMGLMGVALAIIAVGIILGFVQMSKNIEAVDNKVAGIIIGLTASPEISFNEEAIE